MKSLLSPITRLLRNIGVLPKYFGAPNYNVHLSPAGMKMLMKWEGVRLHRYRDAVGLWTIGFGRLIHPQGLPITCTMEQAVTWLKEDVTRFERVVSDYVSVPLNQNQFDALVVLSFNIGKNAFKGSTLVRLLNNRRYLDAAEQFPRWVMGGKPPVKLQGLVNRRAEERLLYLTAAAPPVSQ